MACFFAGAALVSVMEGPLWLGLLVGGLTAWLGWRGTGGSFPNWPGIGGLGRRPSFATSGRPWAQPEDEPDPMEAKAAFRVRCEVVTPRVQVWHSIDTGRAYELTPDRAPADARPGDVAWLSFDRGRPRVQRSAPDPRRLN